MKELISTEALILHEQNRPPTELETQNILKQITLHKQHVNAVDEELRRLQQTIKQITGLVNQKCAQRDQHVDAIAFKHGLLAPIRKLPFELIGDILFHAVETPPHPSPIGFLRICRYFKYVVDNTPKLWSRLHFRRFTDPKATSTRSMMPLSVAWKWLRNAGSYPIAVTVEKGSCRTGHVPSASHLVDIAGFLEIVSHHRLRYIKFITHNESADIFISFLSRLEPKSFKELQSMDVQVPFGYWHSSIVTNPFENIHDVFAATHCTIRSLSIPMNFFPSNCSIFGHITDLNLVDGKDDFLNRLCALLSQCVNLRSLSVDYVGYDEESNLPVETSLSMPMLQELRAYGQSPLSGLFQKIQFPNLKLLQISKAYGNRKATQAAIKQLVQTSNPPLTKLSLKGFRMSEAALIWLLERLPRLVDLELRNMCLTQKLVEAFTREPTPRRHRICPKLESIEFTELYPYASYVIAQLLLHRVDNPRKDAKGGKRLSKKKQYLAPPVPLKSLIHNGVQCIPAQVAVLSSD